MLNRCTEIGKVPDKTVRCAMDPSTKISGKCVHTNPVLPPPGRLLYHLSDRILLEHYSLRTEQAYSDCD